MSGLFREHLSHPSLASINSLCSRIKNGGLYVVAAPIRKTRKNSINSDSEEFETPRKLARGANLITATPKVPVHNTFQPLSTEEAEMPPEEELAPHPTPKRSTKPEPFYMQLVDNHREIMEGLFTHIGARLSQKLAANFLRITPIDIEQFCQVQAYLNDNKISSHHLQPRSERPKKILLSGLPANTPLQEIKNALGSQNTQVQRAAQLKQHRTKNNLPLFMACITPRENFSEV